MRKSIRPYLVRRRLGPKRLIKKRAKFERSRQRRNLPHLVTVYLRINDAYSYLLLQVLDHLQQRYRIEFDFRTVLNLQSDMYPAPMLWQKNAFSDCVHLSDLYREVADLDIEFCSQQPTSSPQREAQLTGPSRFSVGRLEFSATENRHARERILPADPRPDITLVRG
jgi:hypothetical protein